MEHRKVQGRGPRFGRTRSCGVRVDDRTHFDAAGGRRVRWRRRVAREIDRSSANRSGPLAGGTGGLPSQIGRVERIDGGLRQDVGQPDQSFYIDRFVIAGEGPAARQLLLVLGQSINDDAQ